MADVNLRHIAISNIVTQMETLVFLWCLKNKYLTIYLFVCTFPPGELSDLSKIGSENEKQKFLALLSFVCSLPVNVVSIFSGWLNIEHRWRSTDFLFCELIDKKLRLLKKHFANPIWTVVLKSFEATVTDSYYRIIKWNSVINIMNISYFIEAWHSVCYTQWFDEYFIWLKPW